MASEEPFSIMSAVLPELAARFASLTPLLAPRSLAIVGASSDATRIGGRPIAFMQERKFAGPILPVNPNRDEILGLPAYKSVADLPQAPDAAIVAVPANLAVQAIDDLGRRGCKGAVVFTAGFAEVDADGSAAQARMVAIAHSHGMRLIGPNSLGVFNDSIGYFATFSSAFDAGWPVRGRIGIASQSGAYGTHLCAAARNRGIGASLVVATGNEADTTVGDVIGWMAGHDGTDVIAVYAEAINRGDVFLAALAAARDARKPVVMMKVGRSSLGRDAALSHTASIAGDDAVTDAVLAEFGVVRARTTEEMLDIAHTATRRIYPARNTLGVITVSGGAGVLISDTAETLGLELPPMPTEAQAKLKSLVSFCAPRNPVDCTAQVANDLSLIETFTDTMVADGGYTSVLAFLTVIGGSRRQGLVRERLAEVRRRYPDRLFVISMLASAQVTAEWETDGFICHEDPTRATVAISAMGIFGKAFNATPGALPPEVPRVTLPAATPSEAQAKLLLAELGIPSAPERACASADSAVAAARELGFPVVLKILSADIVHKSEIGGVILGVRDEASVRSGFAELITRAAAAAPRAKIDGVLVARQLSGGVECIMGTTRDPVFGPVAMFGLGGIFVEVMKDVVFHRCPFGEDVAETMIRSIKGAPLLLGARGREPADISALARMLSRLSVFAHQAGPALQSVDLNPVFAMPAGQGAFAADAVLEIGP